MYNVSEDFKSAIYAPARTTKAKVTFDISDVTAAGDVTSITTSAQASISDKNQLINKKRNQTYNLATFENDRFKLDGSFTFADDTISNNGEMGFVSDALCGADNIFSPAQEFIFEFSSDHSSMGITITFDVLNEEYATDFTVTAYDSSYVVIETVNVTDNDQVQCTPIGQLYNYRKIVISITKWSKPYRRCRVVEVDFGVVRVYEDDSLIKMSLVEEVDLITSKLPSPEFKFTVDNADRAFNILNPSGFYKYLQQRQQVIAELGVDLGSKYEYVSLGNYLLWEWMSDEGSLTASFTARTNIDLMSGFDYENLTPKSGYDLYQMAEDIFAVCGITNYDIDTGLQSISTNGLVKKSNCKSILQMIALAGCANIFIARDNTITIKVSPASPGAAVDTIDMDNMYKEPQIELDKIVKAAAVTYWTDLSTSAIVTVTDPEVTSGDTLKLENNTLINSSSHATDVANWLLQQKGYRAIYDINWRGNPAHELMDVISIENSYGESKSAFITKNSIEYRGYLKAKTEARGVTDIVD